MKRSTPYSENPEELLKNALDPILIKKTEKDLETNSITVVVDDSDYPIVLGKRGMNARLNAKLIGKELLVKKMSDYHKEQKIERHRMALSDDPYLDEALQIEDVNPFILDSLKDAGFDTLRKLLNATPEEIAKAASISQEMADNILDKIKKKRM